MKILCSTNSLWSCKHYTLNTSINNKQCNMKVKIACPSTGTNVKLVRSNSTCFLFKTQSCYKANTFALDMKNRWNNHQTWHLASFFLK